jgi:hypothetical protein
MGERESKYVGGMAKSGAWESFWLFHGQTIPLGTDEGENMGYEMPWVCFCGEKRGRRELLILLIKMRGTETRAKSTFPIMQVELVM